MAADELDRRIALARASFSEVIAAVQHEDNKAARIVTAFAFLTTAATEKRFGRLGCSWRTSATTHISKNSRCSLSRHRIRRFIRWGWWISPPRSAGLDRQDAPSAPSQPAGSDRRRLHKKECRAVIASGTTRAASCSGRPAQRWLRAATPKLPRASPTNRRRDA